VAIPEVPAIEIPEPLPPEPEPELLEPPCAELCPLDAPVPVLAPVPPRPSGVLEEQDNAATSSEANSRI
jgi:hypothetical protein